MPSCDLKEATIECPRSIGTSRITLPIAKLHTMLPYAPQLLYHSTVHKSFQDDGTFRFFAFEPSISLNYVQEEMVNQNAETKFMHVFKIKKAIPHLALFADSEKAMGEMGGLSTSLLTQCPPKGVLTPKEMMHAKSLGMSVPEYLWASRINQFKVGKQSLNGWIRTTTVSSLTDKLIDPGLEVMLNVDSLDEYLEHVFCWSLEDYKPSVVVS